MRAPDTIGTMLAAAIATDPTRPLLTYYDDASGERTELSGATLANWVAKTANMIVDETALGVGARASVGLPPHWQTAAVLLGAWSVGLAVEFGPVPADVAFVYVSDATHEWPAGDRYVLDLHPFALPMRSVPDAYEDFNSEVRRHGDHFRPVETVPGYADAFVEPDRVWTHADLVAGARQRAADLGIAGGRVLVNADTHPDALDWLLAPLAAGASIVLCRNLDPARVDARAESERVTVSVL